MPLLGNQLFTNRHRDQRAAGSPDLECGNAWLGIPYTKMEVGHPCRHTPRRPIYTYLASRAWLLAVGIWFVYLIVFCRLMIRDNINKWLVFALVTALTIAPLAIFFFMNPLALSGRAPLRLNL